MGRALIVPIAALLLAGCRAPGPGRGGPDAEGWRSLLDGPGLGGFRKADFGGPAEPHREGESLIIPAGDSMAGVVWAGEVPFPAGAGYQIELEAMRVSGSDIFCGLTFPAGGAHASLIIGGWGGGVCGISSIEGLDASENETTTYRELQNGRWHRVRLQVSADRLEAWLDEEKIVDVEIDGRRLGVRFEIEPCLPLGFATWRTAGALRAIRWRALSAGSR